MSLAPSDIFRRLLDNWPAKVIAVGLAVFIVLLNDLANVSERQFSVPLQLRLPDNLVPGAPYPNRVRVRLRGDEARIFNVLEEDIRAYADFRDYRSDGDFRATISIEPTGTALDLDALEISVEPVYITVTLEEKRIRSLEVVPNIVGFPPPGYELSDYRLSPTTVDVVGPRSRLEDVTQILTEAISLSGRTTNFSERVRLVRPDPLVELPGGNIVDFRALILETVVQTTFADIDIAIVDLDPALSYVTDHESGSMRVQGKQLDVEGIPPGRIGLFVDAGAISGPGTYTLPVRPQIPGGILVLSIEPARIEVTVTDATQRVDSDPEEESDDEDDEADDGTNDGANDGANGANGENGDGNGDENEGGGE